MNDDSNAKTHPWLTTQLEDYVAIGLPKTKLLTLKQRRGLMVPLHPHFVAAAVAADAIVAAAAVVSVIALVADVARDVAGGLGRMNGRVLRLYRGLNSLSLSVSLSLCLSLSVSLSLSLCLSLSLSLLHSHMLSFLLLPLLSA